MRKKLKYQGGITKFLCLKLAEINKKRFREQIIQDNFVIPVNKTKVNFDVISFSGGANFEDQFLSIYSFLYYAGVPIKWTIYSDKTYTDEEKAIFTRKFPFVIVLDWDVYKYYCENEALNEYLKVGALAKKINIIIGHPHKFQTLYVDSDIVFYQNFPTYINCGLLDKGFWFVPDTLGSAKISLSKGVISLYALNSGLLILNEQFNIDDIFAYLKALNGGYGYFSEQSSFEYAFRRQNAQVLDPRQYIIDTSDQFDFGTKYHPTEMAMRHFTSPVRHKIWQYGWRWHFKT